MGILWQILQVLTVVNSVALACFLVQRLRQGKASQRLAGGDAIPEAWPSSEEIVGIQTSLQNLTRQLPPAEKLLQAVDPEGTRQTVTEAVRSALRTDALNRSASANATLSQEQIQQIAHLVVQWMEPATSNNTQGETTASSPVKLSQEQTQHIAYLVGRQMETVITQQLSTLTLRDEFTAIKERLMGIANQLPSGEVKEGGNTVSSQEDAYLAQRIDTIVRTAMRGASQELSSQIGNVERDLSSVKKSITSLPTTTSPAPGSGTNSPPAKPELSQEQVQQIAYLVGQRLETATVEQQRRMEARFQALEKLLQEPPQRLSPSPSEPPASGSPTPPYVPGNRGNTPPDPVAEKGGRQETALGAVVSLTAQEQENLRRELRISSDWKTRWSSYRSRLQGVGTRLNLPALTDDLQLLENYYRTLVEQWDELLLRSEQEGGSLLMQWPNHILDELDTRLYKEPAYHVSLAEQDREQFRAKVNLDYLLEAIREGQTKRQQELAQWGLERIEGEVGKTSVKPHEIEAESYELTRRQEFHEKFCRIEPGKGGYRWKGQIVRYTRAVFYRYGA